MDRDNHVASARVAISIDDDIYPPLLREIPDPPQRLFVAGDSSSLHIPQIAIVGSRRASAAGVRLAGDIASALTHCGLAVCSGMALGIDAAAHRGAMDAGGNTTAVLGTGVDVIYPGRHKTLAAQISKRGCLVSEYPHGTPPLRHHFPARNRIISGLAAGVVIIEAAEVSGSLITARMALEQGREVFALPWSPLHHQGAGCLRLLREGAKLVTHVDDILEELGPFLSLAADARRGESMAPVCAVTEGDRCTGAALSPRDRLLLEAIGYEAVSMDELASIRGTDANDLANGLTSLEIAGHIKQVPGGFIRC